ncbi:MAG: carboxymuconolactone decarboxylase family protein [Anaerolineae bacterium]|nr:carboxymuconolactone decarboxylase family protein [Anaerolineae bacterium]
MAERSWHELLTEYSETLSTLAAADARFLEEDGALPAWVKQLMALQLDAVFNHPRGVRWYGRRAQELGATSEQIVEALRILSIFAGRPALVTGAERLRDLK